MPKYQKIAYFLTVIGVLFFSLVLGGSESSADSIYLPLIMNSFPPKFSVMVAEGGKVKVSPLGKHAVQKGEKIALEITPEKSDVEPILLINGKPVETTRSGMIYQYDLIVVGDTSVYATSAVEPKLTANTKIIDEATANCLTSISADKSVLTFNCVTPYLQSLRSGDIIIIGVTNATPYGLLRKVTNITIQGAQVTVETTDATLKDAIEEGEIIVSKALNAGNIMSFSPLLKRVALQETMPGPLQSQVCLDLNNVIYDFDGDESTTNDQIALNGSVCLDPTINFALGIKWHWLPPYPELKNLIFSVGLSESTSLELTANYTISYSKEIPIADIYFQPIQAGYVTLVPNLTVYVGFDGRISAGIKTGVTQNAGLTVGLQYSDGDWSPINDHWSNFSFTPPALTALEAKATVYAKPQFNLLVYGVAGPYVDLKAYLEAIMEPLNDPWLRLWGGLDAGVGVLVKVLDVTLADYGLSFPIFRVPILQLPGNKPPSISSLTANSTRIFPGDTSSLKLTASDPEDNSLTCTWAADGGTMSSITGCSFAVWTAPGAPGTYKVSVSVTDGWPGYAPVTATVPIEVVKNLEPTIRLDANPLSIPLGGSAAFTLTYSDPERDAVTCTWSATGGSLSPAQPGCVNPVTWTAPAAEGDYYVTVSVTDNRPGHPPVTDSQRITVGPIGCVHLTSPAANATLDNACPDMNDPLAWAFAWNVKKCSGTQEYEINIEHNNALIFTMVLNGIFTYIYKNNSSVITDDWQWKVRPVLGGIGGEWSTISGFNVAKPCNRYTPTGLLASSGSFLGRVNLQWTAPAAGTPSSYSIWRKISADPLGAKKIGTTSGLSYEDQVGDINIYFYWVTAIYGTWESPYSDGASGSAGQVPGVITEMAATDDLSSYVSVRWNPPPAGSGGPVTGFTIWRAYSNNSAEAVQIKDINTALGDPMLYLNHWEDYSATNGATYWYWVRAYNPFGPGPFGTGDSGYRNQPVVK